MSRSSQGCLMKSCQESETKLEKGNGVMSQTMEQELQALRRRVVELEATNAARAAGITNSTVLEDVVTLAESRFKYDVASGKVIRFDEHGTKLYRGNDPITLTDWLQQQRTEKPHLFRDAGQSSQSGSNGSNSGSSGSHYSDDPAEYRRQREREIAAQRNAPVTTDARSREASERSRAVSENFGNGGFGQQGGAQHPHYSDDPQEYMRQRRAEIAAANGKR